VLEQQRVHLGIDEVVHRDHFDVRRALEERLERLAADPSEAIDSDSHRHVSTPAFRVASGRGRRVNLASPAQHSGEAP
jgi:hypothetical protein